MKKSAIIIRIIILTVSNIIELLSKGCSFTHIKGLLKSKATFVIESHLCYDVMIKRISLNKFS